MAIGPSTPPTIYQADPKYPSGIATFSPADFAWRSKDGSSASWPGVSAPYPAPLVLIDGQVEFYIGALSIPDTVTVAFFHRVKRAAKFPDAVDRYDLKEGDLDAVIAKAGRRRRVSLTVPKRRGRIMRMTISYSNDGQFKPSVARYFFKIAS